ncbi:MAG: hypothetical protein Q8R70_02395, partial [Methanoregula sp.]|nr:hypothetical protein [Methanoregula sp.]
GWIEEKEYFVSPEANEELADKIIAYQKKEWLSSIMNNKDARINKEYKKYQSINDAKLSHPGFDIWHGEATVGYTSPITYEQIDGYSFADLIDYFEEYELKPRSFSGPSVEGLSDIIVSTIKQNPEKYCNAELVVKTSFQMQYIWIRGLKEACEDKTVDIQVVLKVSEVIFANEGFWEANKLLERDNFPNFYLSELLRIIEFGLTTDHKTFSNENLPQIKSFLINILVKDEQIPFEFDELSMKLLNNSKGKLYSAVFQYLLKYGRENKEDKEKLNIEIEEIVDFLMNKNVSDDLLYFSLGQFLPYIFTLYPEWTKNKIDIVFPKDDTPKFNATICGYFFYNSKFYLNEFNLLNNSGVYGKALDYDFRKEERGAINNLVRQILVALVEDLITMD